PPARRRPGAPPPPSAPPPQQRCEPSRGARSPATRVATSRPPRQRQPPTSSAPSAHRPPANHHRPTASAQFRACAGAHYLVKATFARISPTEWPKSGQIRVPVSIWHGADDRNVGIEHAMWLSQHIPGAQLHIIEGEGHV